MSKTLSRVLIIILSILTLALICLNVTFALMFDRKDNTGIIQFKQHILDIEIIDNDSIILTPEELTIGANATRKLTIKNPENSTSCVLRIWLEFYIEDEVDTNYLNFNLGVENFTKSDSGKYYYNRVLASNGSIQNLVLNFSVSDEVSSDYAGKEYTLKLFVESIQATKGAVDNWSTDYPAEWRTSIENSLN